MFGFINEGSLIACAYILVLDDTLAFILRRLALSAISAELLVQTVMPNPLRPP